MKSTTLSRVPPLSTEAPNGQRLWTLRLRSLSFLCKRLLDLLITVAIGLILWPVGLVIALLIKWDSPGPVFFRQERVGARRSVQDGKEIWEVHNFYIFKFRSMVHNADPALHQAQVKAFIEGTLACAEEQNAAVKIANDPRITRIGRFLRKTSLDELPQLLNVVRGEMSIVGPRPVPTYEVALYREEHYRRLLALPGMTGLWQVVGRGEVTFDEMMRLDLEYVQRQSIWLDLWILLMTIPAVLRGQGAI